MAAEYEVNIKLNTQEIKTQLNEIDKVVKDIGKGGRGGGSKSGAGAGIAKQLSLFTADSIFGRGRITGTALKNVKLSWLGAFDEIQDVANTIGGRRSTRLLNVKTSWGKAFEGLAENAKVLELGGLNTQTSWGKALSGLQDNAKVLKLGGVNTQTSWGKALIGLQDNAKVLRLSGVNTQTSWGKALAGLQDNAKVLKLGGINTQTSWGKALTGLQDNAKVLKLSGINTQTSWGKALTGLQDNAKVLKLGGVNTQTSWTKALTGLQDNAKVLNIQNLNVRTSWGKALEQLGETAEIIAKNAAAARAQFLAGAPIPGLAPGQTAGPARPPVQGAAFPIGGTAGIPGSPEFQRALAIGRFRSSPIQGAANIPGSPEAKRARRERLEQVGLGAGFPLLFGGGAGSILGGGLGGLTGSFGAQIAFSAIGQQIDQFVAGMVDAGKALTSVGGAADFMAEKSLFSSDAMQFRIEKLIEEGQVTEAAALMTQEMAKKVGGSGLKALKDLGTEASKMGKIFSTLLIRVQAFLAKALTPLLKMINMAVGGITAQSQLDTMLAEARSPEERARMLARSEELRGVRRHARTGRAIGLNRTTPEVIEQLQKEFSIAIPEGAAIEPTGLELLRAADSGADKAAKDKERAAEITRRAQEKLQIMQQEGDLAKELKKLDFERAAEIEKINKLENVGLEERQNAAQATNDLFDAKKGKAIGEALAKDLQTAIDLKEAQQDVLRPLEDQRRLLQGKLDGNEKEVRLQLQIEEIMRSVDDLNEKDVENAVRKNALLQEQIAIVEKLDQVYASIGESITSGIVDSLTAAVEGTKSLADIASQTLRQVSKILLQFGVQSALSGLGGDDGVGFFSKLFPQRALGGNVSANKPYMVGERGPELFVPGAQGNVVPNNAMGGANVVVNVDASGSSAQGNGQQAKALGQAIGAAVQAELIKQKRPGGILS